MAGNGDELDAMPEDAIGRALEAARARVARAERARAELDRVIATAREEERLLDRLLALRRDGAVGGVADNSSVEPPSPQSYELRGEKGHPALKAVLDELRAAGRPLHISELMRLLSERKVAIPGLGTQANLITHLRRDDRLVRPSRGMYGLTAWGLQGMPATHRTRRRRKRMRSTASHSGRTQE